jgi:hypothetical protein
MTGPARITIDLEPGASGDRLRVTRTVVDEGWQVPLDAMGIEPREPGVVPAPYEPPTECQCVEGDCAVDHANE